MKQQYARNRELEKLVGQAQTPEQEDSSCVKQLVNEFREREEALERELQAKQAQIE